MVETILTYKEDRILTITLNRPDALNAFIPEMLHQLRDTLSAASMDEDTSAVVIEGAGRAFSAGVDLKVLQGATPSEGKIGDVFDGAAYEAADQIRNCAKPVIAKVHGFCFTGALEIALHCDMVYTTVDTKFGDTHAKFGLRPTWGMTQTLPRAVGMRRARELSFTARTFSGEEAASWGLANEAVADKKVLDALVAERAGQIATNSKGSISAYKNLYALAAEDGPIEEALNEEMNRDFPEITDTVERLKGFG